MTAYVILVLVLAGLILVAAALFDRWRSRQVAKDFREGSAAYGEPGEPGAPQEQVGRHRAG